MPSTNDQLIHIQNLSLKVPTKTILEDISFEVKINDFLTIIGPNGAGKSSLLKCIVGILKPTSGSILNHQPLNIGFVPQKFHPNPMLPITVKGFLELDRKFVSKDFDSIIDSIGIQSLLQQQLNELSGGELQKVLIVRALLKKPNLLALDEPAQNLDAKGQTLIYQLLECYHKENQVAVIMISHDLQWVMLPQRRVICLNKSIICDAPSEDILKTTSFISLFGEPVFNFNPTAINDNNNHIRSPETTPLKINN